MKLTSSRYYIATSDSHRWQGDLYKSEDFNDPPVPSNKVPYWMLLNRTCHLVEGQGRSVKLPYLVFCTVTPLTAFVAGNTKNLKNQVSNIVKDKDENIGFLPETSDHRIPEPLVADFNMIWSFRLEDCPSASQKVVQLSSPFAEHMFQRFARWFYTVGYDDSELRDDMYIKSLLKRLENR